MTSVWECSVEELARCSYSVRRECLLSKHGDSTWTQREGYIRHWKPLLSTGIENMAVDINMCM
jgi:hypothetical protein